MAARTFAIALNANALPGARTETGCAEILVGDAVAKVWELVLHRKSAAGVVCDGEVGVELGRGESHQPPRVVCGHVEAERCRNIARNCLTSCTGGCAFGLAVESHQRLVQTAGVTVGKSLSPELYTTLEPDLVLEGPSSCINSI